VTTQLQLINIIIIIIIIIIKLTKCQYLRRTKNIILYYILYIVYLFLAHLVCYKCDLKVTLGHHVYKNLLPGYSEPSKPVLLLTESNRSHVKPYFYLPPYPSSCVCRLAHSDPAFLLAFIDKADN